MAKEILSIRLSADGLSFWTSGHAGEPVEENRVGYQLGADWKSLLESVRESLSDYRGILAARGVGLPALKTVYADTLSAVLVPDEIFDERDAGNYMDTHGFTPEEGQYTVCSKPICGTVAVMKLNRAVMETLGEELGEFKVAHLLQYNLLCWRHRNKGNGITVYISTHLCHITAFNSNGMAVAESYPYASLADIQYYISCIMQSAGIPTDCPVYVCGERAEENTVMLSRTFQTVLCG